MSRTELARAGWLSHSVQRGVSPLCYLGPYWLNDAILLSHWPETPADPARLLQCATGKSSKHKERGWLFWLVQQYLGAFIWHLQIREKLLAMNLTNYSHEALKHYKISICAIHCEWTIHPTAPIRPMPLCRARKQNLLDVCGWTGLGDSDVIGAMFFVF